MCSILIYLIITYTYMKIQNLMCSNIYAYIFSQFKILIKNKMKKMAISIYSRIKFLKKIQFKSSICNDFIEYYRKKKRFKNIDLMWRY